MIALLWASVALAATVVVGTAPSVGPSEAEEVWAEGTVATGISRAVADLDARVRPGVGVRAGWTPTERWMLRADAAFGSAWTPCVDCGAGGLVATARYTLAHRSHFRFAPTAFGQLWKGGSATVVDGGLGFAMAAGGGPVWVDLSAPLWGTDDAVDLMSTLGEVGVTARYLDRHSTRLALQGYPMRPVVAHRVGTDRGWVQVGVRPLGMSPGMSAAVGRVW